MRGSRRSWRSTRIAVASVTRGVTRLRAGRGTRRSRSSAPVRRSSSSRRAGCATIRPSRTSSSSSQRSASSMTWLETSSVVPASASSWNVRQRSRRSTGSRPTVGSSSTSSSGRAEQRRRERDARVLAAGERAHDLAGAEPPRSTSSSASSIRSAGAPSDPREVARGSRGRVRSRVDGRRLGHVADPAPQPGDAGGQPEHRRPSPAATIWHADDRAHQRRLAGAARAEQAGDAAGGHVQGHRAERVRGAANDVEVPDANRGHPATITAWRRTGSRGAGCSWSAAATPAAWSRGASASARS